MKLLERANARGTTVVVVTHNMDVVNSMRKRVITLSHGILIKDQPEGYISNEF
jgi:cell division transport system ATP-binding protein